LDDGRILVVEYNGEHSVTADGAKDKRLIGELWADPSQNWYILEDEDRQFARIDQAIPTLSH